jgi:hypothetical protein
VLIAEEHEDTRTCLAEHLRRCGFDVLTAASGELAMQLLRDQCPAVVSGFESLHSKPQRRSGSARDRNVAGWLSHSLDRVEEVVTIIHPHCASPGSTSPLLPRASRVPDRVLQISTELQSSRLRNVHAQAKLSQLQSFFALGRAPRCAESRTAPSVPLVIAPRARSSCVRVRRVGQRVMRVPSRGSRYPMTHQTGVP